MNPRRFVIHTAFFGFVFFACFAGASSAAEAEPATLQPVPLVIEETANGRFAGIKPGTNGATFLAVVSKEWPAGLVPVYVVEKAGGFELRRTPAKGTEGFSEPAFFALPASDEPDSAAISGKWEAHATRSDGSKPLVSFEISAVRGAVIGRFDQNTDYRFAYITGGSFKTNRLTLAVEYIRDHFEMTAELRGGRLSGRWRNVDDSESGTWEATRAYPPSITARLKITDLAEWKNRDGSGSWRIDGKTTQERGERTEVPLCRVWK
jgi:hypothetical protein